MSALDARLLDEAKQGLLTVRDLVRFAVSRLHAAGVFFGHGFPDAPTEAEYLVGWALDLPPGTPGAYADARVLPSERDRALALLVRRVDERVPAAYLTGEAWLGEFRFRSDARAIVPRSFIADLLPDALETWLPDAEAVEDVLDLCTGSGCLAILAAIHYPDARVTGLDLSPDALALAKENIADYGLADRVRVVESDLFAALGSERFDLILYNPPYVDAPAMASLPPEYRHEPVMALASGPDGLDFVRRLLRASRRRLKPRGVLVVEVGHNAAVLEQAFPNLAFTWLETHAGPRHVFLMTRDDLPDG